jgi:hypothetical protein
MNRKYICPACQLKAGVKILFGFPSYKMFERSERGEIALGGCVLSEESPDYRCLSCGHEWQIVRRQTEVDDALSPLSAVNTIINDKFGADFDENDKLFWDQVNTDLSKDEALTEQARTNDLDTSATPSIRRRSTPS